jgi:alanyl-tRNA synthetase
MAAGDVLAGETAFKLYDTFGFPYDLTEDALRARGFGIDRSGFDAAMAESEGDGARGVEGLGREGFG